jgi:hypothetical protein
MRNHIAPNRKAHLGKLMRIRCDSGGVIACSRTAKLKTQEAAGRKDERSSRDSPPGAQSENAPVGDGPFEPAC